MSKYKEKLSSYTRMILLENQNDSINQKKMISGFIRVNDEAAWKFLEENGCMIITKIENIATFKVSLDKILLIASSPYIEYIEITKKVKPIIHIEKKLNTL